MHLLETHFERAGLQRLNPNARDIAEQLLGCHSLAQLLLLWQQNKPDIVLLKQHHTDQKQWADIVQATILAKATNFFPNKAFTQAEWLYLIKAGCLGVGKPLSVYSIKDVLDMTEETHPVFNQWLRQFTQHLKASHRLTQPT